MKEQIRVILVICLLLGTILVATIPVSRAVAVLTVPADYPTIQDAVDAASPGDTILVANGTYFEHVTVYKEDLSLVGENPKTTVIESNYTDQPMYITADNVYISGFTMRDGATCGIYLYHVINVTLVGNIIADNMQYGIYSDNSSSNIIMENTITNNPEGIFLWYSNDSIIYHNNFNNTVQAFDEASMSTWDDGYPSGGNYWSNYNGTDLSRGPNQNMPRSDGIGDTPMVIDANNVDHYPLMKPYAGPQDIGIKKSILKTVVSDYYPVTVINYGNQTESFNLTFQVGTISYKQTATLQARDSTTLTFSVTALPRGKYTLTIHASPVLGQTDTTDNTYTGQIIVTILGDVNGDFKVNILDVVMITSIYGTKEGNPKFNPNCDLNNDGAITILDVVTCTGHYGQEYP